jgi:hypothetical protein
MLTNVVLCSSKSVTPLVSIFPRDPLKTSSLLDSKIHLIGFKEVLDQIKNSHMANQTLAKKLGGFKYQGQFHKVVVDSQFIVCSFPRIVPERRIWRVISVNRGPHYDCQKARFSFALFDIHEALKDQ